MKHIFVFILFISCGKSGGGDPPPDPVIPPSLTFSGLKVNGIYSGFIYNNINKKPVLKFSFSAPLNTGTAANSVTFKPKTGAVAAFTTSFENNDSTIVITPSSDLVSL